MRCSASSSFSELNSSASWSSGFKGWDKISASTSIKSGCSATSGGNGGVGSPGQSPSKMEWGSSLDSEVSSSEFESGGWKTISYLGSRLQNFLVTGFSGSCSESESDVQ